jgi:RNA polymerase sigma-70 factor (ECF subfamily)
MSDDAFGRRRDLRLVQRLLAGEETAFEEFAEGYFAALLRFALSRLDRDEEAAADVVQNTLTTALRRLESFRGESSLMTWLCGICRFEIGNALRHRRRQPATVEWVEESGALEMAADARPRPTPEEDLAQKELAGLVHLALDRLPAHYAQALEWKYLEGAAVEEIAHRLEMGTKAAESLLSRARRAFKDGFDSERIREDGPRGPQPERGTRSDS